jgi:uncharacterized protein DUF3592
MNAANIADAFNKALAHPILSIMVLFAAGLLGAICWGAIQDWFEHVHGRNWPTVDAVIDIVSVAFIPDDSLIPPSQASLDLSHYKATLTYTYHNPDEQMGDYSRDFGNEDDAKAWANSYKGETVKVHVDPRDPARSVLREEDL